MSDPVTSDCYRGKSELTWKGNKIKVEVHCFWGHGPGGLRTYYTFFVNNEKYTFSMIDSFMKGTCGQKPSQTKEGLELCFFAGPTVIEIIERPVETK